MKPLALSVRRKKGNQGFSLVEVVLSLGVIAFAFIPVLGLLPVGLDASRQAIDATVEAQIVQQLSNEAFQTDFSLLTDLAAADPFYFDYQGNKTTVENAIYTAGFLVNDETNLPGTNTEKLATITICILNIKAVKMNNEPNPGKNPAARKSTVLMADNGR